MLNVSEVFTSKWIATDTVRDTVKSIMQAAVNADGSAMFTATQISTVVNALDTSVTSGLDPSTPFADFQYNSGIVIPDTSSCISIATKAYQEALGDDIDTTSETHVGRMIEQTGKILASALGITAANVMQHDLNSATGAYLDAIASWFFESRKTGRATSRQVTLAVKASSQGDDPVTVDADECYFTDGDGVKYSLSESVSISSSDGWKKLCVFVAEDVGSLVINDSGLTWKLPDEVEVSSTGVDTIGYDIEDDDTFRARLKVVRSKAVAFMEAVNTAIYDIVGVYDAYIGENCSSAQTDINSLPVDGHSIVAVVSYDGTTATRAAIAKALYDNKAVGCGYTNLEEVYAAAVEKYGEAATDVKYPYLKDVRTEEVQHSDATFGTVYTVTFNTPAVVQFGVNVTVSKFHYAGVDLEKEIQNAITSWASGNVPYVDGLKIGQDIKAFEIGAAISAKIPDIQVNEVSVTYETSAVDDDGETSTETVETNRIPLPSYAVGQVDQAKINITIEA